MEVDPKNYFIRILNIISRIILWMMANVYIGLYKGLAFFDASPGWANYLYYILFIASLVWLYIYIKRKLKM